MTTTTATASTSEATPAANLDEAAVLAAVTKADAGTGSAAPVVEKPAAAPAENADGKPPAEGAGAKPGEKKAEDKPADAKPDDKAAKPESAFTKAQKDADRRDKSWKALDAEKTEFRAEKTRLETEMQSLRREIAELKKQPAAPAGPVKDAHGHTAETYDELAKHYADEGRDDMAKLATAKAAELRQKAATAPQQQAAPAQQGEPWKSPEFQARWDEEVAALIKADATLADPKNPITQAANALVNNSPWAPLLRARPDGIRAAVEVAKLQQAAATVEPLRKELETTKAEVARLTKLVQPGGSLPGGPTPEAKKITDMSSAEAEQAVIAAARAADANPQR